MSWNVAHYTFPCSEYVFVLETDEADWKQDGENPSDKCLVYRLTARDTRHGVWPHFLGPFPVSRGLVERLLLSRRREQTFLSSNLLRRISLCSALIKDNLFFPPVGLHSVSNPVTPPCGFICSCRPLSRLPKKTLRKRSLYLFTPPTNFSCCFLRFYLSWTKLN